MVGEGTEDYYGLEVEQREGGARQDHSHQQPRGEQEEILLK